MWMIGPLQLEGTLLGKADLKNSDLIFNPESDLQGGLQNPVDKKLMGLQKKQTWTWTDERTGTEY